MKSNVSDQMELVQVIYRDACAKCSADVSDLRDLMTIKSRVETEGLSFLTITLPNFARDFERSLELGYIDSTAFRNFRKTGSIPSFLRGMTSRIFDLETGRIRDDEIRIATSDVATIVDSIRQICLAFKKVRLECDPKRTQAALENFISTENAFEMFSLSGEDSSAFASVSSLLWDNMFGDLRLDMLLPRHGPGATSEGISGNQKYRWRIWHERLETYFPLVGTGFPISCYDSRDLQNVSFLPEEIELPVKVTPVPKDLKGPRIIAIEPSCMQYAQQGIRDFLYGVIESNWITGGHINFADQSVNQSLAIEASRTTRLATIDLSDASDRVPRDLALSMFRSNPDLQDAIDACRSRYASMPDGQLVGPLNKFASMGSALCFPVEAMYFYTICIVARLRKYNLPVTVRNIKRVARRIFVYGDDIIVPSRDADIVLSHLQKYNCKVNTNKTFYTGRFRESCGVDAFNGQVVSPIYLREMRPKNKQQAAEIVSWVATANLFYKKGYWHTASLMFSHAEKILKVFPYVSELSSVLGRNSFLGFETADRWNRDLQRLEVRGFAPESVYRTDYLSGYGALMKSFLDLERVRIQSPVSRDVLHLERSALHGAVALKRRWAPLHCGGRP